MSRRSSLPGPKNLVVVVYPQTLSTIYPSSPAISLVRCVLATSAFPAPPRQIVEARYTLSANKGERVGKTIDYRGCDLLYSLSPYSPDPNPTEEALSKVKRFLRIITAWTKEALAEYIGKALDVVGCLGCKRLLYSPRLRWAGATTVRDAVMCEGRTRLPKNPGLECPGRVGYRGKAQFLCQETVLDRWGQVQPIYLYLRTILSRPPSSRGPQGVRHRFRENRRRASRRSIPPR